MDTFLQACVNGLMIGGFYSLMGMGQNIIFGVMKIINFCHGVLTSDYYAHVFGPRPDVAAIHDEARAELVRTREGADEAADGKTDQETGEDQRSVVRH